MRPPLIETPIISINSSLNTNNRVNYDEDQYLTPEYHNYSTVDHENEAKYYIDNNLEDQISNNYVEVMEDYIIEPEKRKSFIDKNCIYNQTKTKNNERRSSWQRESTELTRVEDDSFDDSINPGDIKVMLSSNDKNCSNTSPSSTLSTSSPTTTDADSTFDSTPSAYHLHQLVSPDENSKAKKILQRT